MIDAVLVADVAGPGHGVSALVHGKTRLARLVLEPDSVVERQHDVPDVFLRQHKVDSLIPCPNPIHNATSLHHHCNHFLISLV